MPFLPHVDNGQLFVKQGIYMLRSIYMDMVGKPGAFSISEDELLKKRTETEASYRMIGSVHCPFLKEKVNFNSSGLEHLKFKEHGRPRNPQDQYIRLKLLYLAPEIIRKSNTVQGYCEKKEWERQKRHGHWEQVPIDIRYNEFIAVIGKIRIKVIVKKIGSDGEYFFWSIIPFWKMRGKDKILSEGNPTID